MIFLSAALAFRFEFRRLCKKFRSVPVTKAINQITRLQRRQVRILDQKLDILIFCERSVLIGLTRA
ncbi:hypothetical protein BRY73_24720 [Ochrobactrum sp. P6BS-III]|nr:hypothetical protein BRY73_24720 [Ochrobactrum sp. P6BS-III]